MSNLRDKFVRDVDYKRYLKIKDIVTRINELIDSGFLIIDDSLVDNDKYEINEDGTINQLIGKSSKAIIVGGVTEMNGDLIYVNKEDIDYFDKIQIVNPLNIEKL